MKSSGTDSHSVAPLRDEFIRRSSPAVMRVITAVVRGHRKVVLGTGGYSRDVPCFFPALFTIPDKKKFCRFQGEMFTGTAVGVALFRSNVSDQLSSLREELPVRRKILLVRSF